MADEEKQEQKPQEAESAAAPEAKGGSKIMKFLPYIIIVLVVAAASVGGIALAQLMAGPRVEPEQVTEEETGPKDFDAFLDAKVDESKTWVKELTPVVANLDEPGVTRYVRATIAIEFSADMDQVRGEVYVDDKSSILIDWLNTYLAGLSLEEVRGTNNLERIKQEVRDHFNELLFPDSKPYVIRILLKEFAVQ